MEKTPQITGRRNELILRVRALHLREGREKEGAFLLEGVHLLEESFRAKIWLDFLFYTPSFLFSKNGESLLALLKSMAARTVCVSEEVMEALSSVQTPQGILGVARMMHYDFDQLMNSPGDALLILEGISDPGNLGTIFRTALAAGAKGLILVGNPVDLFNPKVVRASAGAILRLPFFRSVDAPSLIRDLESRSVRVILADQSSHKAYVSLDPTPPIAFFLGGEAQGISPEARRVVKERVSIPLERNVESLNVAVAAGVLLFWHLAQMKDRTDERLQR